MAAILKYSDQYNIDNISIFDQDIVARYSLLFLYQLPQEVDYLGRF